MTIKQHQQPEEMPGIPATRFQKIMAPLRAWWTGVDAKYRSQINVVVGLAFLLFLGLAIMMLKGLVQFI
jgi:hypothetical protein